VIEEEKRSASDELARERPFISKKVAACNRECLEKPLSKKEKGEPRHREAPGEGKTGEEKKRP